MKRTVDHIANWLQAEGQHTEGVTVTGVSIDSRTVKPGDLFIPFRGEQLNGHRFVTSAIEKGAAASLWMKDEPNPPEGIPLLFIEDPEEALQHMARSYRDEISCKIIGVTGSNGKTSTKDLIYGVLSPYFRVKKTEGNFNNELGLPITLLSLEDDTEYAVLEMGMSGFGEISFLSHLAKPHYAIITNIGEAHMQDLGSRAGIAKAKFEIIDGLQPGGMLFYDGDEPLLQELVVDRDDVKCISFGNEESNGVRLLEAKTTDDGSEFTVAGKVDGTFFLPVYGSHQVKNALAAILLAAAEGIKVKKIQQALGKVKLTDMRMQPIVAKNGALFINDAYNAAPTSMKAALNFLRQTSVRRDKWVVLADMLELGTDEQQYHEEIAGWIQGMNLKGICLFGPRMKWLYDKVNNSLSGTVLVWTPDDYRPIVDVLKEQTDADSVVLLKGSRGMALERVLERMDKEENE